MQIGAISYQPYVYKPNAISSSSLSKVKGIGDDLLASKTDFSGVSESTAQNTNPLKRGETKDFAGILMAQMQMGRANADRLLNPATPAPAQEGAASSTANAVEKVQADNNNVARMQQASQAYLANMIA